MDITDITDTRTPAVKSLCEWMKGNDPAELYDAITHFMEAAGADEWEDLKRWQRNSAVGILRWVGSPRVPDTVVIRARRIEAVGHLLTDSLLARCDRTLGKPVHA